MGLAPGTQVSENVRLTRPLDQGGMGAVWIAEHLTLGMEVAVKFISSDRWKTDPTSLARFEREAKAAASIKSPHVVQMLDHGVMTDGTPYIVMELLEGESLAERLARRGALGFEETAEIVSQSAKALSAAHDRGVVHRDVKPGNIFLLAPAHEIFVKVLDFGIAKQLASAERAAVATTVAHADLATDDFMSMHDLRAAEQPTDTPNAPLTATGAIVGTPQYMSPEQLLSTKDADFRTDIWALGVVAYQALTGHLPFAGDTMPSLCMAICTAAFHPPSTLRPGLPPALDPWFRRALAVDIEARFASVREAADQFRTAVQPTVHASGAVAGHHAPARHAQAAHQWPGGQVSTPSTFRGVAETLDGKPAAGRSRWPWLLAAAAAALLTIGALLITLDTSSESADSTTLLAEDPSSQAPRVGNGPKAGNAGRPQEPEPLGSKFDRKRLDVIAFVPQARIRAREHLRDPELVTLAANGINGDGLIDNTKYTSAVVYYFGARGGDRCALVSVMYSGVTTQLVNKGFCSRNRTGQPRCSLRQVVARATRKGPPDPTERGLLSFHVGSTGRPVWVATFGDLWMREVVDDC